MPPWVLEGLARVSAALLLTIFFLAVYAATWMIVQVIHELFF